MKVFGVTEYKEVGDLSALKEYEVAKPSAPTGKDLLVKVKAVATNPIDYKRLGNLGNLTESYDGGEEKPLVVGWDASGVVEAVGDATTLFQPGDEVYFAGDFFRDGAFAEYVLVDERIVGHKPTNLTFAEAASAPLTSLTAWEAMVDQLKIPTDPALNKNKTILIVGGGGGVSTAAVEMAKRVLGFTTVIGTGSRPETVKYLKSLGADHVVNHHKSLTNQIQKDLDIEAVDYVVDAVSLTPELFTEYVALTKAFGGILSIWPSATVDLMQLFWKSINFSAVLMFTRPTLKNEQTEQQHKTLTRIAEFLESGTLSVRQTKSTPLTVENLREALTFQSTGKAVGKTTLYFEE